MKKIYLFAILLLLHLSDALSQSIAGANPSASNISETVSVTLTGNNCQFTQPGASIQVWMSAVNGGITIFPDQMQVISANQLLCTFTFTSTLTTGWYNINLYQDALYYLTLPYGFNLNPPLIPFTLTGINPAVANSGQVISVNISGQGASFAQGTATTDVSLNRFNSNIQAYAVIPNGNNQLTAQFALANGIPTGPYNVVVNNSIDGTQVLSNGFTVTPNPNPPALVQVSPNNAMQNTSLSVSISGQNTHFGQGTTTTQAWFSQGSSTIIYSTSVNAISATQLSAALHIPGGAPTGLYDMHVQNGIDGHLIMGNAFLVTANPNAPQLVSVDPGQGQAGQVIPVTITGQNTNFTQGTATVNFTQGSSTLAVYSVSISDDTHMQALVDVPYWAPTGLYQANVYHSYDGSLSLPNSFEVTAACGMYAQVVQQPCAGNPAMIYISGGSPPYTLVISGVNYASITNSFNFSPPQNNYYQLDAVYDASGCAAVINTPGIYPSPLSVSMSAPTQGCQGIPVTLTTTVSDFSQVYGYSFDYGDGTNDTSTDHTYTSSGNFLPVIYMNTTCGFILVSPSNSINILPSPALQTTITPATCGLNNGSILLSATGTGPFLYTINSSVYPLSSQNVYNNLAPGPYLLEVLGSNGCSTISPVLLSSQSSGQNLSGTIFDASGNPSASQYLALYALGNPQPVSTTVTNAAGSYSFSNLVTGDYLLAAIPNPSISPNLMRTYAGHTAFWDQADTLHITCNGTQTVNIEYIANSVLLGSCSFEGYIMLQPALSPMANTEVILYDAITMVPFKAIYTDANGYFNFSGIPPMYYGIRPEIPFYSSTFPMTYNGCYLSTGFSVDPIGQSIESIMITGNHPVKSDETSVFPNPFSGTLYLQGNLAAENAQLILTDVTGKMLVCETLALPAGPFLYEVNTSELPVGMYLLQLRNGARQEVYKVFKQ